MERDPQNEERAQRIAQLAKESGKSVEKAEHDIEIDDALALLEREIPGIQSFFNSEKRELHDLFQSLQP